MLLAILTLGGLGLVFGFLLAFAGKKLVLKVDPRLEEVIKNLPGVNCGSCGWPSCEQYAEALVKGEGELGRCTVIDEAHENEIARILGKTVSKKERLIATVGCRQVESGVIYDGIKDCQAAALLSGINRCEFGCLGLGSCQEACKFGAITISSEGLPQIGPSKCTGCSNCVKVCPSHIITLIPILKRVYIACSSHSSAREVRQICSKGCIGCGKCVKACPQNAITLDKFLAKIDYTKCDGCGKCAQVCPTGSIISG